MHRSPSRASERVGHKVQVSAISKILPRMAVDSRTMRWKLAYSGRGPRHSAKRVIF